MVLYITACQPKTYGPSCSPCHCDYDVTCDLVTGACPGPCASGWIGDSCAQPHLAIATSTQLTTETGKKTDQPSYMMQFFFYDIEIWRMCKPHILSIKLSSADFDRLFKFVLLRGVAMYIFSHSEIAYL